MRNEKRRILIWLPVILLPLANVILAIANSADLNIAIHYIIGAIAEELFFRFFLLKNVLLPRMKPILAIALVSILFAGMHLFNLRAGAGGEEVLVQIVRAFCFSVWAGAVTWKATWLIPLLAHVLLNATAGAGNSWVSIAVSIAVLIDGILLMKDGICN